MKILHSTHGMPGYMPPPTLAPDQIIFGPYYQDSSAYGEWLSLKTPKGVFDIAEYVTRLPASQYPELVVVRTDSFVENRPRNIGALRCPAVLVVGDTQHGRQPLQGLLDYALSEPFQSVIFCYNRHHAHFFIEAGLPHVHWLPGFELRRIAIPAGITPDIPLSFVGQVGTRHARRQALCQAMIKAKLPLQVMSATIEEARLIHARTRVNFNCSLNGDLNLRVFEIMQSGSLLLTDRLSPQSGLELLFAEGEHLVLYDSLKDCVEKIQALLAEPDRAQRIAQAGNAVYEECLSPERIARDFFALIDGRKERPEFDLRRDRRLALIDDAPSAHTLKDRIAAYEVLQQLHAGRESTDVLITPGVDPRFIADIADLKRLLLTVDMTQSTARIAWLRDRLIKAEAAERVEIIAGEDGRNRAAVDVILGTNEDWRNGSLRALLSRHQQALVLLTSSDDGVIAGLVAISYKRVDEDILLFAPTQRGS
jgi:hypothetical protein